VKKGRAEGPALAVDAGDTLLPDATIEPEARAEARRRADVMVGGLGAMGLDAYLPGDKDLGLGLPALKEILKPARFPVVATNLVEPDGQHPFLRGVVRSAGSLRVAILGLADPGLFPPGGPLLGEPVDRAATEALAGIGPVDFVLCLAHVADGGEPLVAAAAPRCDAVVASHGGSPLVKWEGGRPAIGRAANKGRILGLLEIGLGPGYQSGRSRFAEGSSWKAARKALEEARVQKEELLQEARTAGQEPAAYFAKADEAKRMRWAAANALQKGATGSLARMKDATFAASSLLPLEREMPDDPAVLALVEAYQLERRERERLSAGIRPADEARPETSAFAGAAVCARCHAPATERWQRSPHARALATLQKSGHELDPQCIGCHATGWKHEGGFSQPAALGFLGNVQCEACHGPGKAHVAQHEAPGKGAGAATTVTGKGDHSLCARCHTPENDPEFRYPVRLEAIRHW
jgi:hypothetical protein